MKKSLLVYIISFFFFFIHVFFFFLFLVFLSFGFVLSWKFCFFFDFSFEFMFIFDWISCGFSSFVFLISMVVFFYSLFYLGGHYPFKRFLWILFFFVFSMIFLIFSFNLFGLVIGWDGLGMVSFLLVIYYSNFSSLRSGLLTILVNRLGDLAIIVSFFIFFISGGSWFFVSFFFDFNFFLSFFVFFAAMTKSAQLPFSSWLPAAMAAPTPVSSLVHSSTLVTAGVYLLIRFYHCFSFFFLSWWFSFFSVLTMFFSGFLAFFEVDMKKIIAMSTLSQLGMMMFVVSLGEWVFCFFHMVCHALFKALLFLSCGGFIFFSFGDQDLRMKGGFFPLSSFFSIMFFFSSLSLCGFPFFSGFFSKDLILESSFGFGWGLMFLMFFFLSCLFSLVYSIRLLIFGMFFYKMSCSVFFLNIGGFMFFFLFFLGGWSMISGYFFSFFLFFDSFFVIFSFLKFLGLLVILFGFLFFLFLCFFKFSYYLFDYFSDMFFMFWFSGWYFSKFLFFFESFNFFDFLWLEIFGPKMVTFYVSSFGQVFLSLEFVWYSIIYFFVGLVFMFFILFLYFLK